MPPAAPAAFDFATFLASQTATITGNVLLAIGAGLGIWAIVYSIRVGISKFAGFARKG